MKIAVISPEGDEPRELAVLAALGAAGLERYHVRKPRWSGPELAAWLAAVPNIWRRMLVLHQHHELATEFGCGGVHFKDGQPSAARNGDRLHGRACHSLASLEAALGREDAVFFSPVFPSISKPGHGPQADLGAVTDRLGRRTAAERRTEVLALGGITPGNCAMAMALGFDGVAVLGALWKAPDPLGVFLELTKARTAHAA